MAGGEAGAHRGGTTIARVVVAAALPVGAGAGAEVVAAVRLARPLRQFRRRFLPAEPQLLQRLCRTSSTATRRR
jgi:hypothetical protein